MRRVLIAIVVAAVLAMLPACANRTDEAARAAGMTPRNAVAFVSLSLDPSIAQKKNLLEMARKFPTARDKVRKDFQQTRDSLLSDAVEQACLDFTRDVKPWLGSEVAVAAIPSPSGKGLASVVFIKVKEKTKARKALDTAFAEPCKKDASPGTKPEFRFVKGFAVVAGNDKPTDNTAVLDAVDHQAKAADGGLASTAAFTRLEGKLHGDRLVLGFADAKAALAAGATGGTSRSGCDPVAVFGSGGSVAFDVHVGSASVVLEGVADQANNGLKTGAPKLTQGLPGDTTGALTLFDVAGIVRTALSCSSAKDQIQGDLADQTGLDLEADILSWMGGEAVLVAGPVRPGRDLPDFALVVAPTDQQKAQAAADKLKTKLTDQGGALHEFDVNGTTGFTAGPAKPSSTATEPAMVLLPGKFILATSPDFVRAIASPAGAPLGQSASYRAVVGEGTGDGTQAQLVIRISAVKDAIARRNNHVAPELDPLDTFGIRVFQEGGLAHVEMKLTLK